MFRALSKSGNFGYEMEIIVPADSKMQSPSEIKGMTMASQYWTVLDKALN